MHHLRGILLDFIDARFDDGFLCDALRNKVAMNAPSSSAGTIPDKLTGFSVCTFGALLFGFALGFPSFESSRFFGGMASIFLASHIGIIIVPPGRRANCRSTGLNAALFPIGFMVPLERVSFIAKQ